MSVAARHPAALLALTGLGLGLALLPVALPAAFEPGAWGPAVVGGSFLLGLLAAPAALFLGQRLLPGPRRERVGALLLAAGLTVLLCDLQRTAVDEGHYFAARLYPDNTAWQLEAHGRALALDASFAPHSYRVLPNALVRWWEPALGGFAPARALYRHVFTFLWLVACYAWVRTRFAAGTALLTLALTAAVMPVAMRCYAGQLADPLSYLSFALALLCLERRDAVGLAAVLAVGTLAKESVLALAPLWPWLTRGEPRWAQRSLLVCGAGGLSLVTIRLAVQAGGFGYTQVSGVSLAHVPVNLADPRWPAQFLLTVGLFAPFLLLAWRRTPDRLRLLGLWLVGTLFGSSLLFSWLREARNYIPAVLPLAAIAAAWLLEDPGLRREPPQPGGESS